MVEVHQAAVRMTTAIMVEVAITVMMTEIYEIPTTISGEICLRLMHEIGSITVFTVAMSKKIFGEPSTMPHTVLPASSSLHLIFDRWSGLGISSWRS